MGEADRYAILSAPGPEERLVSLIESISSTIDLAEWRLKNG